MQETGEANSVPGIGRSPEGGNSNALQYSCLENPMDGGAWWATDHEVTKSQHSFNWLLLISIRVICISGSFFLLLGNVLFYSVLLRFYMHSLVLTPLFTV